MDHEMENFQKDLLASVRQMKAGKAARVTEVTLSVAAEARAKVGLSQSAFAQLLGAACVRCRIGSKVVAGLRVRPRRC